MSGIAERIRHILAEERMKQKDLASLLSTSAQTVNNWIKRDSVSREAAQQIADKLGYSLDWLLNGKGPMKVGNKNEENIPAESEWGKVAPWDSETPVSTDEVEVPFLKDIEFACGDGSFDNDDHNGFMLRFSKSTLRRVGANTSGDGVLCFPATGSSLEPIIPHGTTVAVDTNNKRIIDGKLYAINHGGLKRIKQLYRLPNDYISIRSYNKDEYEDQDVPIDDIEIIGKVFWYSVLL